MQVALLPPDNFLINVVHEVLEGLESTTLHDRSPTTVKVQSG
jgi:hypothetical protein